MKGFYAWNTDGFLEWVDVPFDPYESTQDLNDNFLQNSTAQTLDSSHTLGQ